MSMRKDRPPYWSIFCSEFLGELVGLALVDSSACFEHLNGATAIASGIVELECRNRLIYVQ